MQAICDVRNKGGERIGCLPIKSITPRAADKLYETFIRMTRARAHSFGAARNSLACAARHGAWFVGCTRPNSPGISRILGPE